MHRCASTPVALFSVLASFAVTGCGRDGATNPGDSTPDPNRDRLEITVAYAGRSEPPSFLIASMDLFQITKDDRLATPFVSTANIERHPQRSNDGKKLLFTSTAPRGGRCKRCTSSDGPP